MSIKKSIVKVFCVNFFQLVSSLIVGFCVPSILSIEAYADFKTYTLLLSYIGFFHFGFIDGLFIKYGGKKLSDINKQELKSEHIFLILLETIISIIIFIVSVIFNNLILFLFALTILPLMISNFHKYIYQATGEFDKYSKLMNTYTFIYMLLNILLALVLKNQNYIFYTLTTFTANLTSIILIEFKFLRCLKNIKIKFSKELFNIMKVGFIVLLGNLVIICLFGIDKWFVKLFLSTEDFAFYSFAVSMLNIINTLVNAISITFYNYLFENNNESKINNLKDLLIVLGGGASLAYFPLSIIVSVFLKKYIPSLEIISITFAVFPYMILINALYVNLYKVNKNEKHYLNVVLVILFLSIIYNVIALLLFHNTVSLAFATIMTLFTWVVYSTKDLKNVTFEPKTIIYLISVTISFLASTLITNIYIGFATYIIFYFIITFVCYKKTLYSLKNEIFLSIKNKLYGKK